MVIDTEEIREIIIYVWNKLYFDRYGAFKDGVDMFRNGMEIELNKFIEEEGKKIASNYKEV